MVRRARVLAVAPLICVLTLLPDDVARRGGDQTFITRTGSPLVRAAAEPDGPATPTDYGDCGPGALRETALQGEVPIADQQSGRSAQGYQCNVRRIGRSDIGLRGQNFQLAWYGDCAYVSTVGVQAYTGALGEPDPALDGIAVVDASDERNPQLVDVVKSPVAKSSHEALEVNQSRGLLVTTQGGLIARYIEVYDVKHDCRHPTFLGRYDAGIPLFHGLRVADDGNTVYGTDTFAITGFGQIMHAVDISDPRQPRRLLTWDPLGETPAQSYASHDLEISPDGNRLYLGTSAYQALIGVVAVGPPSVGNTPSLAILDTSDVQARKPNPDIKVLSTLSLPNFGHTVQRIRIGGKPYLLVSGEAPIGGPQKCPWAWGHIVDISDERHPRRVSDLRLEVNRQSNCPKTGLDGGAIYSIHYVGVDSEQDTSLVFYTYYTGGMRVFDVRDPEHPREVGYFQPPATPGTKFPALSPLTPDSPSKVFDYTTSMVRYRPETGHLWVVSVNSGFQVLELTGKLRGAGAKSPPCHKRKRLTLHLDPRLRTARASIAGKRVPVHRIRGRLVATIDLRRTRSTLAVIRISGTTHHGNRLTTTRRIRICT
jgi:hypothetical protein